MPIVTESLLCICLKKITFLWDENSLDELRCRVPTTIFGAIKRLHADIRKLKALYPSGSIGAEHNDGIEIRGSSTKVLPEACIVLDSETRQLDFEKSILASEPFLSLLDFFDLCSKMALDQPSERVYGTMSETEQEKLEDMDREPVVWCRALELSPRRAIIHYDDIALSCAQNGYLRALERSLMKVREGIDTALLQRCVIAALLHGHYHIANATRCENYASAFHYFFPDGRVSPRFFAQLLDRENVKPEVGEQIAADLLDWLTKHDIHRLRRHIQSDPRISAGVLHRFDSMYRDCIDHRDYPCEYD